MLLDANETKAKAQIQIPRFSRRREEMKEMMPAACSSMFLPFTRKHFMYCHKFQGFDI